MRGIFATCLVLGFLSLGVHGFLPRPSIPRPSRKIADRPIYSVNGTELPPFSTIYYFDQLVDHNDSSKGTFKQRYWHTWEWYQPGGPIVIMSGGENNAEGDSTWYLGNTSINGMIAQQEKGATIIIEHRFFGESNPYNNLSTASLSLLTVEQSISDLVYFAENVKLPMPGGDAVSPKQAPWVLIGGSYPGALTAWAKVVSPDTFYAAYASSAVVEAINDFWKYFEPIREHMPANCSADVQAVISHVDKIFMGKDYQAINQTKTILGLSEVEHLDDVMSALRTPMWYWQNLQPAGENQIFYAFCDALEVKDGVSAPAEGWGLEHALAAYGTYMSEFLNLILCGDDVGTCWNSYNATESQYTNIRIDNADRSYAWLVCNELGFYQEGAPKGQPTIVSRLLTPSYDSRLCTYRFPEAFHKPTDARTSVTNRKYHGWKINEPRLFFANGDQDPWREATMSAKSQNIKSTDLQPIAIGNGFHCSDLLATGGQADASVKAVQDQALASMKEWLAGWSPPGLV